MNKSKTEYDRKARIIIIISIITFVLVVIFPDLEQALYLPQSFWFFGLPFAILGIVYYKGIGKWDKVLTWFCIITSSMVLFKALLEFLTLLFR